jgi:hypothetical protein
MVKSRISSDSPCCCLFRVSGIRHPSTTFLSLVLSSCCLRLNGGDQENVSYECHCTGGPVMFPNSERKRSIHPANLERSCSSQSTSFSHKLDSVILLYRPTSDLENRRSSKNFIFRRLSVTCGAWGISEAMLFCAPYRADRAEKIIV